MTAIDTLHKKRVQALVKHYDGGGKFHSTVAVRDWLNTEGIKTPTDVEGLSLAYRADIEARNILAHDPTTKTVVPPAMVSEDGDAKSRPRSAVGDADYDLRREVAMSRRISTEIENGAARWGKISDKHPKDIDIMRASRDFHAVEAKATKLRHTVEAIISGRFNGEIE